MRWFEGSIAEAVSLSKQRNSIFVVFVEGNNELSSEMSATIDEPVVLKHLSDESSFLAVKLKSGSIDYTHFAQLYQFVPVPSLFFIGRNGTPLEVVCAGVKGDDLARRVNRILEEHRKEHPLVPQPAMQPSTSAQAIQQTAQLIHAEASQAVQGSTPAKVKLAEEPDTSSQPAQKIQKLDQNEPNQEYEVVCEGDVCVRRPKAPGIEPGPSRVMEQVQPTPAPEPEENIEEKLEKAKQLIEARRREKEAKEKELEKQKEMERRAAGQGIAELKRWQEEQEFKQIQEERKREKLENSLARERILQQIAQDRAERRARDTLTPTQPQTQAAQATENSPVVGDGGVRTRIQFKLPDGVSHTAHFASDDTLDTVRKYVRDNLQNSSSNFSLWTAFPRRELTETSDSLRHLQLTPSAALLVLPDRNNGAVSTTNSFSAFISFLTQLFTSMILEPSTAAIEWVRARLFPPPPTRRTNPPPPNTTPDTPMARRRGNVHRLPGDTNDDDNNTWNGNSTQQM